MFTKPSVSQNDSYESGKSQTHSSGSALYKECVTSFASWGVDLWGILQKISDITFILTT
jgi:hypothetical protein